MLSFGDDNSNLKGNIANQFIDDEAESSDLDCISDEEKSLDSVDESEDEEGNTIYVYVYEYLFI